MKHGLLERRVSLAVSLDTLMSSKAHSLWLDNARAYFEKYKNLVTQSF